MARPDGTGVSSGDIDLTRAGREFASYGGPGSGHQDGSSRKPIRLRDEVSCRVVHDTV